MTKLLNVKQKDQGTPLKSMVPLHLLWFLEVWFLIVPRFLKLNFSQNNVVMFGLNSGVSVTEEVVLERESVLVVWQWEAARKKKI